MSRKYQRWRGFSRKWLVEGDIRQNNVNENAGPVA
jgi:hypothetical protein